LTNANRWRPRLRRCCAASSPPLRLSIWIDAPALARGKWLMANTATLESRMSRSIRG
jgi:hypothetical protein